MKIKINRNVFLTGIFVSRLEEMGLRNVCISPGSRSTPLTLSFAANKRIKKYIHIDERSSAFFALGLAKVTGIPAAVVCTSGTAAVELYPAIVEAYQQRVPLIICTADRPADQRGKGANQTINQENLYKNHIRYFVDAGLPEASFDGVERISCIADEAFFTALKLQGPVHINFPFAKPFEPDSYTDEITTALFNFKKDSAVPEEILNEPEELFEETIKIIRSTEKGLIIAGPDNYNPDFSKFCRMFSETTGFPIIADVNSHLRTSDYPCGIIVTTYDALLRNKNFKSKITPDLIIHFGRTPTSKMLLNFLASSSAKRIMINRHGDWFDPSGKAEAVFASEPSEFCRNAVNTLGGIKKINEWQKMFIKAEESITRIRENVLQQSSFLNEAKVIHTVINNMPDNSSVMVSNSSPVRDLDYFTPKLNKTLKFFSNRGASGIDGILSTALGITAGLKKPFVLITGDLAFYYDLTSLLTGRLYRLPLIIVLLNNNGGGIFNNLPVASYKTVFQKYFITPHNLKFGSLVKSFGWNYKLLKSVTALEKNLNDAITERSSAVFEIRTDAKTSLRLRKDFWNKVAKLK